MRNVRVLMSTYNSEKYIDDQIKSIINQKGDFNLTLLVRDDGSTDSTLSILEKYSKKGALDYYVGVNKKSALSFFDLLINAGDYEYYAFSDQDDIWDEDKIEKGIKKIEGYKNFPCVYSCNSMLIDSDGHSLDINTHSDKKDYLIDRYYSYINPIVCSKDMGCTMIFNYTLYKIIMNHGKPEKMIMHDSYIISLCWALDGYIYYDCTPHMKYRQHTRNVVGRGPGLVQAIKYRIIFMFSKKNCYIGEQVEDLLLHYGNEINSEKKRMMIIVKEYRSNIMYRLKLTFTKKLKFITVKDAIFIRASILFGAR